MTRILVAIMDSFMSENVHFLRITNDHRWCFVQRRCQFSYVEGGEGIYVLLNPSSLDKPGLLTSVKKMNFSKNQIL